MFLRPAMILTLALALGAIPATAAAAPGNGKARPKPTPTPTASPTPTPTASPTPTPTASPTPTPTASPTPTPAPSTQRWFGFNDISPFAGRATPQQSAGLADAAGAQSTRMILDWSWLEREDDLFSWSMVDGVYAASVSRGIRPLIGITGAPAWARDAGATCTSDYCPYPPAREHYDDFREIVQMLVRRYPSAVAIEIGNEPNLAWAWAGGVDAARYTELLKTGYAAVKSVDPAMPVLSAGLAPVLHEETNADAIGLRPFLQAMYDNGAKGHMDGISLHPYPYATDFGTTYKALSYTLEVLAANADDLPVWVTEIGLTNTGSNAFPEATSAVVIPELYKALRADREVRAVYVHTLIDEPENPNEPSRGYGALRSDLTPKPLYCALADANGAGYDCPATVIQATPGPRLLGRWEAQVLLQTAAEAALRYHRSHGTYLGMTSAALNAIDSRISATPAPGDVAPGSEADPSQIGVYPRANGVDGVLLCNTSRADFSYCITTVWRGNWTYGHAAGNIYATAYAINRGGTYSW